MVICYSILFTVATSSCDIGKNDFRHSKALRETSSIEIVPIMCNNIPFVNHIKQNIYRVYGFQTNIINSGPKLSLSFINKQKGIRYSADSIIALLANNRSNDVVLSVGYTDKDIFISKRDKYGKIKEPKYKYEVWGIFGLAKRPGTSCIVSSKRLYTIDTNIYKQRLIKITLHEIGHNLGLKHCTDSTCFMTDAVESISTVDNASLNLCDKCNEQIGN